MPSSLPIRLIRLISLLIALALIPMTAAAVGPVSASGLPGGASPTDSDPGSGESWGRSGGRVLTFSVNTPDAFESLVWGAVSQPTAALDGVLTPGSPEFMSFNGGESDLANGVARWNGSALIPLASGTTSLQTRFTMVVSTMGGAPLPLAFASGASPGASVLAAVSFRATLLFEVFYPSSLGGPNTWRPLLEVYDALNTPPGAPPGSSGPALTGFAHGFYYELDTTPPPSGMTLEDHDANISSQLGSIKSDTAFLRIDTVGHFNDVKGGIDDLRNQVSLLPTEFPPFPDIPPIPADIATREDVNDSRRELSDTLLILFGLAPCPADAGPLCDTAIFVQDLATQASVSDVQSALSSLQSSLTDLQLSVDAISAPSSIEMEVIEVPDPPSPKHRRWIVKTSLNGSPINASLSRIVSIHSKRQSPATTEDVTFRASSSAIGPGLLDVTLETSAGNGETILYQIEVSHPGSGGAVEASALVHTGAR